MRRVRVVGVLLALIVPILCFAPSASAQTSTGSSTVTGTGSIVTVNNTNTNNNDITNNVTNTNNNDNNPSARSDPRRDRFVDGRRVGSVRHGISLPATGGAVATTAAYGSVLLAFGLLLLVVARRRRRRAQAASLDALPPIDAVVVEPGEPWLPGTPHPSEFLTEADGIAPVYLPAHEGSDDDILTPSF